MKKIKSKLSLALLPVVVLPLLALGLQGMFLLEKLSQENTRAQVELLLKNSQAFLNASIKTNNTDLNFLPQTAAVNRYLAAQSNSEKNSYIGPMVQLLFHQMMKSNPGILQIVLVNPKQEEELQVGNGIDPFTATSPTNKMVLNSMSEHLTKNHVQFIYSPELGQYVFKQALEFNSNDPALREYGKKPETYTMILTYSLAPLNEYIKEQEQISGYHLILADNKNNTILDPRYTVINLSRINKANEVSHQGTDYFIEHGKISDDISLYVMIPKSSVTAAVANIRWALIIWIVLSMTVLLALCSWILGRLIINPMEKLRRLMHQVAKQEIRHIPLLPPDDEMVELRNQFSLMLSRLEASQLELEHSAFSAGPTHDHSLR